MHKLPMPDSLDLWREDPGYPVSKEILMDTYFNYRIHREFPSTGAWFDQDTHIIDAFKLLDAEVEWNKQNEPKRGNLPSMDDIFAERRKNHKGDD